MMKFLVFVLFLLIPSNLADYAVPPPNLGDVRLFETEIDRSTTPVKVSGKVQVYFTDGGLSPPSWSYICLDTFRNPEANVICRQIGYANGDVYVATPTNVSEYPIWMENVKCNEKLQYSHILHCDYNYKTNNTACSGDSAGNVVGVRCYNPIITDDKSSSYYEGQVFLCPPDSMNGYQSYPNVSTSFGIAAVYFHGQWGGIGVDDTNGPSKEITRYRGNLICQEMGFQQVVPGSIRSLRSEQQYSPYTFKGCTDPKGPLNINHAWIRADDLTCKAEVYDGCFSTKDDPCFGCCYTYPDNYIPLKLDFIILECMYTPYVEAYVPFGNESACSFDPNSITGDKMKAYNTVCAAGMKKNNSTGNFHKQNLIAVSFAIIFGVIIAIEIIGLIIIIIVKKYWNRIWYDRISNDNHQDDDNNEN